MKAEAGAVSAPSRSRQQSGESVVLPPDSHGAEATADGSGAQKPWQQLVFILGEAVLLLVTNGVLFIIISRVAGPELLGTYALAFAWLLLFQGVSAFGIPEYLMREVGAYGRAADGEVVHAMLLGLGSGVVAMALMLAGVRLLGYSPYLVEVITVASLALIPAFINTAARSVFLALRQMHLTFVTVSIEAVIVTSASLYLLLTGHGALSLIIALVAGKTVSASITLIFLYGRVLPTRPPVDLGNLIRTGRTVLTFGVSSMLGMLTIRINTIMVSGWVDLASVGRFAAATKIMEIGLMIPNLFIQLLMTRIAYSFNTQGNRDPNRFADWYRVLFALVLPTCVGGWVFADLILEILFGSGFGDGLWVLRILMIYLAIESADSVMSVVLKAAHRPRQDVTRFAFNPLANILLNLALLPSLGTIGAAIGRVAGALASAGLRHRLIAQVLAGMHWLRFARRPAAISFGLGLVSFLLLDVLPPAWVLLFYVVATLLLLQVSAGFSRATIRDMMSFPTGPA